MLRHKLQLRPVVSNQSMESPPVQSTPAVNVNNQSMELPLAQSPPAVSAPTQSTTTLITQLTPKASPTASHINPEHQTILKKLIQTLHLYDNHPFSVYLKLLKICEQYAIMKLEKIKASVKNTNLDENTQNSMDDCLKLMNDIKTKKHAFMKNPLALKFFVLKENLENLILFMNNIIEIQQKESEVKESEKLAMKHELQFKEIEVHANSFVRLTYDNSISNHTRSGKSKSENSRYRPSYASMHLSQHSPICISLMKKSARLETSKFFSAMQQKKAKTAPVTLATEEKLQPNNNH